MVSKIRAMFLIWTLVLQGQDQLVKATTCRQFCNVTIHNHIDGEGNPLTFHVIEANETHPAIIQCSFEIGDSIPQGLSLNPRMTLIMPKLKDTKEFGRREYQYDGRYRITYMNENNTVISRFEFEYHLYMYSDLMDYSIAICGFSHLCSGQPFEYWSSAHTMIRYNSTECQGENLDCTTTPPPTEPQTTTTSPPTESLTTTTSPPTEPPTTPMTTTEPPPDTTESSASPTMVTTPITSTTTHSGGTSTTITPTVAAIKGIITGISSGAGALIAIAVVLLLIIGIMYVRIHTLAADNRSRVLSDAEVINNKNVSESELKERDTLQQAK